MSANSTIEWTDATWNPVTGCDKVSPGCDNCYAERIATRFGRPFLGAIELRPDRLEDPLRWRKPRRVFVNSVSDLFHPDVPDEFIARVFSVMARAREHTFQILTKRPQRMAKLLGGDHGAGAQAILENLHDATEAQGFYDEPWPLPNVWLGTSVENQRYADMRIPHLLATPAAVRFLSVEPLLGPVSLATGPRDFLDGWTTEAQHATDCTPSTCERYCPIPVQVDTAKIDWVIAGGESGPGARPMHPAWARTLRDECVASGVPFFFKQWGEWGIVGWKVGVHDGPLTRMGKRNAGRELDGRTWDEYPA